MDVTEWQKRLEDNFTINGIVGGNMFEVFNLENACGKYFAETFHGQSVLIDSFQSFFIETLKYALKWVVDHGLPKGCENYYLILLYYLIIFRSFRACETLLLKGYPLDGYSLLRDLKDRAILLAGIVHNITTITSLFGLAGFNTPIDEQWAKVKKIRKAEENRVFNKIIRKDSALPSETIKELEQWEQLFHEEVHGSKFSFVTELKDWVLDKRGLSIGPTPKEYPMAMYMNRATEIAWLFVRLFPYLKPIENAFGTEWDMKHEILDDSFRLAQQGLSKLGIKIGDAFIKFVDLKFSFKKPFYYFAYCHCS